MKTGRVDANMLLNQLDYKWFVAFIIGIVALFGFIQQGTYPASRDYKIYFESKISDPVLLEYRRIYEERLKAEEKIYTLKEAGYLQALEAKDQELLQLQATVNQTHPNGSINNEAQKVFESKGIDATIAYFQSPKASDDETDSKMQETAKKYRFLAQLFKVQDRYAEAKTAYEKMIKYDRTFDALFEYARFLQLQNHYREAMKRYTEILDLEINSEQRAKTLNNLGLLYSDQNKNSEAMKAYQEALSIRRELVKKNRDIYNPDLANTLNNLAVLYRVQNKNSEAMKMYEEALSIRRELVKKNRDAYNPDLAMTLNNLAVLYRAQNKNSEAMKAYEEALSIRRELVKKNSNVYIPYMANTLNNLAVLYRAQNKNSEAMKAYEEALSIRRELAKKNPNIYNPDVANSLYNMAILNIDQNKYSEAMLAYQEALNIYRGLAKKNPDVYEIAYARSLLTGVFIDTKLISNAEEAKKILSQKKYQKVYEAQQLLARVNEKIEELSNKK